MVGPASKEKIDLAKKSEHRRYATQGKKAEAESQRYQRILLIKTCIVRNSITSRADGEEDDAGKGSQVHE